MPKPHRVDEWSLGKRVTELWALGRRGRSIAGEIMPEVKAWAERTGQPMPSADAVAMAVSRYMSTDPVDRRTRQAKAQGAVTVAAEQAVSEIAGAQVDAAQTLQRYLRKIDAKVTELDSMLEMDPESGRPVAPDFGKYYTALSNLSREMRGWTSLLVDVKDRLWQHEQYEKAFAAILQAVKANCPPDALRAIVAQLNADPAVASSIRAMGGGD